MLKLQLKQKKKENIFLHSDRIPLGRNTYYNRVKAGLPVASKYDSEENWQRYHVTMPYKRNGVITILGGSNVGKSVRAKSVMTWILHPNYFGGKYPRPGVAFDLQGEDFRLSAYPNGYLNNNPYPLIYDVEEPIGFGEANVINYTPYFAEDFLNEYKDKLFAFTLNDFNFEDFITLVADSSLLTLYEIIKTNKEIADYIDAFYDEFIKISSSKTDTKQSLLEVSEQINDMQKMHLRKRLWILRNDKVVMDKGKEVDFLADLEPGKLLVFNFHENETYSPLYIGIVARKLYHDSKVKRRELGFKHLNTCLILEEPQIFLDKSDRNMDQGGNKWVTAYLKQGNKFQNLVIMITQAISEVHKTVRNHAVMQDVLISNPTNDDLNFLGKRYTREVMDVIKTLRHESPEREWAYVHGGGNYAETFQSNNSMCQIHLR